CIQYLQYHFLLKRIILQYIFHTKSNVYIPLLQIRYIMFRQEFKHGNNYNKMLKLLEQHALKCLKVNFFCIKHINNKKNISRYIFM
ncbi:hypothetical protein ABPG74_001957, partial [Tetrahymena malaccensis]